MSAVVEQTVAKLKTAYQELLGNDTDIHSIPSMTNDDWNKVIWGESGIDVLVSTVGTFNLQAKEGRRIHDEGRWEHLREEKFGGKRVRKKLFVFYDEAHNLTPQQAVLLLELSPRGIIMASGSSLKGGGLSTIIYTAGKHFTEVLPKITTKVETNKVVRQGLLKKKIELTDCDLDRRSMLQKTIDKRSHLEQIIHKNDPESFPIACYIVSGGSYSRGGTKAAIELWDELIDLGVPQSEIALHVSGADAILKSDPKRRPGLNDTYKNKLSPSEIKDLEYRHIIWNKALREGWDEPWAFVAYIDGKNQSTIDIQQKIGRFIRNPFKDSTGAPALHPDLELQTAYFFIREDNTVFTTLLDGIRDDMQAKYPGVIEVSLAKREYKKLASRELLELPKFKIFPKADMIMSELDSFIVRPSDEDRKAPGKITSGSIDLGNGSITYDGTETLEDMVQSTLSDVVKEALGEVDSRLIKGWIDEKFWDSNKMKTAIAFASPGFKAVRKNVSDFLEVLPTLLELRKTELMWKIPSVKLTIQNPGENDPKLEIIESKNAYHEGYNNMNQLEQDVARTLSKIDCKWLRNPVHAGYGIELKRAIRGSSVFYPDFVAIRKEKVYLVEVKGQHLIEETKLSKLLELPGNDTKIYVISDTGKGSERIVYTTTQGRTFPNTLSAVEWIFS